MKTEELNKHIDKVVIVMHVDKNRTRAVQLAKVLSVKNEVAEVQFKDDPKSVHHFVAEQLKGTGKKATW